MFAFLQLKLNHMRNNYAPFALKSDTQPPDDDNVRQSVP